MIISSRFFVVCLLSNSLFNYAMETTLAPVRLKADQVKTFTEIITKHKRLGYITPVIKELEKTDPSWKTVLANKECCANLLYLSHQTDSPMPPKEVVAAFFGTPGCIEYAKEHIQKFPEAKIRLDSYLVDTGFWTSGEWPTQATDIAQAIIKITNNPNTMSDGRTALLNAAQAGNLVMIQFLIDAGACVNLQDAFSGTTPLIEAVKEGHLDAVKMLIAAGASIDLCDNNNKTASEYIEDVYTQTIKYDEILAYLLMLKVD